MNNLNEETGEQLFTEQSESLSQEPLISQFPILPRSAWQDEQAFLRAIIRAKKALDIVEITAILWQVKIPSAR